MGLWRRDVKVSRLRQYKFQRGEFKFSVCHRGHEFFYIKGGAGQANGEQVEEDGADEKWMEAIRKEYLVKGIEHPSISSSKYLELPPLYQQGQNRANIGPQAHSETADVLLPGYTSTL
ncbi:hypothetical protein BDW59DRAFT_18879 [Aspergillus cavernicola]|uniref:PH domain-containing protein n=1 Tax=Aspergillus cavernicola TaxID=176166 RepID=A0ABR4IS39_9EURO